MKRAVHAVKHLIPHEKHTEQEKEKRYMSMEILQIYIDIVCLVNQNVRQGILFAQPHASFVVLDQSVPGEIPVPQPVLDGVFMSQNIGEMVADIVPAHYQAVVRYVRQIRFVKIFLPVKRYVTAFYDKILSVFYRCLYDFRNDRPQIRHQPVVIVGFYRRLTAPDQAHFQMVNGQVGKRIFFQQLLRQNRLSRVCRARNQHYHTPSLSVNR